MIKALSEDLAVDLAPDWLEVGDSRVQIDGIGLDPPILVEAWAHHGSLKGSQPDKITADILKLATAAEEFDVRPRLILLFADETAAAGFTGKSWRATACRRQGIEVVVVEIPEDLKESIRAAQAKQHR